MPKQVDVLDPVSYKICNEKAHTVHICRPPKNTVVINRLLYPEVVRALGNRVFFTAEDVMKMKQNNPQSFQVLQQYVNNGLAQAITRYDDFLVCGVLGELYVKDWSFLSRWYDSLDSRYDLSLSSSDLLDCDECDWMRIEYIVRGMRVVACHVPLAQKFQFQTMFGVVDVNKPGVSHGKGDFVLCFHNGRGVPHIDGRRWVVNGAVFAQTYDNRGWTNCLSASSTSKGSALPEEYKRITQGGLRVKMPDILVEVKKYCGDARLSRKDNCICVRCFDPFGEDLVAYLTVQPGGIVQWSYNGNKGQMSLKDLPAFFNKFSELKAGSVPMEKYGVSSKDPFWSVLVRFKNNVDVFEPHGRNAVKLIIYSRGGSDYDDDEWFIARKEGNFTIHGTTSRGNEFKHEYSLSQLHDVLGHQLGHPKD